MKLRTEMELAAAIGLLFFLVNESNAQRQMERLGRGVVAINQGDGKVFVSWRLLGTDPDAIAFDLYRATGDAKPVKRNKELIKDSTNFVDEDAKLEQPTSYFVRPVLNGKEQEASAPYKVTPNAVVRPLSRDSTQGRRWRAERCVRW